MIDMKKAWNIVYEFIAECTEPYAEHIVCILLTGSLARGSYQPGLSDIDVITVLCDDTPEYVAGDISALYNRISNKYSIQFGPIILRHRDFYRSWDNELDIQPELLRLKASGHTLYGKDIIPDLPTPTKQEMWEYDLYFKNWIREYEPHWFTNWRDWSLKVCLKVILGGATSYLYYKADIVEYSKHAILETFSCYFPDFPHIQSLKKASYLWQHYFEFADDEGLRKKMTENAREFENYVVLTLGFGEKYLIR